MEDDTFELRHFRDVLELLAVTSRGSAAGDTFIVGFDLDHVMQLILPNGGSLPSGMGRAPG